MPIKYIGRTTNFKGKTLWEIVGNLKNFGVGRVVVRSAFERYPEKSWLRIIKVEPLGNPAEVTIDDVRKVKAVVERVFRGTKFPKPVEVCSVSYKTDYRLLSRNEEKEYCKLNESATELPTLSEYIHFPPLLKELLMKSRNTESEPLLKLNYRKGPYNRVKANSEKPPPISNSVPLNQGLGKPASLRLYENVLQ